MNNKRGTRKRVSGKIDHKRDNRRTVCNRFVWTDDQIEFVDDPRVTDYTIGEHQHRLAAWAAGRAASVKGCRFKVKQARLMLEAAGFTAAFADPSKLPKTANMDRVHRRWRLTIIKAAKTMGLTFSHGVAAKLINCYLKIRFVCGGLHENKRVQCLHPPIDEVLLKELAWQDFGGFGREWEQFRQTRWSKFDSQTYQDVINHIRSSIPAGTPLWKIEMHWEGHQ